MLKTIESMQYRYEATRNQANSHILGAYWWGHWSETESESFGRFRNNLILSSRNYLRSQ